MKRPAHTYRCHRLTSTRIFEVSRISETEESSRQSSAAVDVRLNVYVKQHCPLDVLASSFNSRPGVSKRVSIINNALIKETPAQGPAF